ncbi:hypothetical protein ACIOYT_00515 [Streptomyces halstedii]|uniref:hypothetical protein n=1 Tax=Streptomyces halstedii TaxID=1944 RepID=UPI0037FCB83A
MMGPIQIAETRARQSDDPRLYMLAYSAGWNAAMEGGDLDQYARRVGLEGEGPRLRSREPGARQPGQGGRLMVPTWMAVGLLAAIAFLALFGQRISDHINRRHQP